MTLVVGFDVYGTLIDTAGVTGALRAHAGDAAPALARAWREKQLEYSFRRALMRDYVDFSVCTAQALDYAMAAAGIAIDAAARTRLLELYRMLPAFADVPDALAALGSSRAPSIRLFAFSNGREDDVESLLAVAGIRDRFEGVVSLQHVPTFKPDPAAYSYFQRKAGSAGAETWLVSGNPFDVIGAIACGWRAAWVRRSSAAQFDPWGVEPTATVASLAELVPLLQQRAARG